jgi:hypothetical protein
MKMDSFEVDGSIVANFENEFRIMGHPPIQTKL